MDVTHADPQAQVDLRTGSADHDESAASISEASKRQHYALPEHVSFNERNHKLTTFGVESFGRLGVEGSYYIDQLAATVVGGRDRRSMARKGVLKERLLQIVSVTTQVAISRRVSRFNLQLRDGQDARRGQGGGDDTPMIHAHPWRGVGVWTRRRNLGGMVIRCVIRRKAGTSTAIGVDG